MARVTGEQTPQNPPKVGANRGNAGKGRPKGSPNRLTADVKDMVLGALRQVGGQGYLAQQARENPAAFIALVGKLLPKDINANVQGNVSIAWPLPRTALDQ